MSNDLKCLPINFFLLTMCDALCDVTPPPAAGDSFCKTKLNGIFRVALKAIFGASGVELNYTKKR